MSTGSDTNRLENRGRWLPCQQRYRPRLTVRVSPGRKARVVRVLPEDPPPALRPRDPRPPVSPTPHSGEGAGGRDEKGAHGTRLGTGEERGGGHRHRRRQQWVARRTGRTGGAAPRPARSLSASGKVAAVAAVRPASGWGDPRGGAGSGGTRGAVGTGPIPHPRPSLLGPHPPGASSPPKNPLRGSHLLSTSPFRTLSSFPKLYPLSHRVPLF